MSSSHYVVRIYPPLILPPSSLFPSLHPSRLFPSLCCWIAGRPTTLNILQSLFQPSQHYASSHLILLRDPFICQPTLFCFLASPVTLHVLSVLLQFTSTGLSLKCSLGQSLFTFFFVIHRGCLCAYVLKYISRYIPYA